MTHPTTRSRRTAGLRRSALAAVIALGASALGQPGGAVQPPPPVGAAAAPAAPSTTPAAKPVLKPTTRGKATTTGSAAADAKPGDAGEATTTAAATSETVKREILLELGKRTIHLVENGTPVRSWPVAIGDPSTPTPTGVFKVENKVVNPQYQSTKSGKVNPATGPGAPLGDRWIGFKMSGINQYGIHGTPWPHWVQTRAAVSNGCVRMLNHHVRELFEKVDLGTPVVVRN